MAMFTGYFEVLVNFNVENLREKFIFLISILYPIYSILIRSQNLLCFLRELLMSFLNTYIYGACRLDSTYLHRGKLNTFVPFAPICVSVV